MTTPKRPAKPKRKPVKAKAPTKAKKPAKVPKPVGRPRKPESVVSAKRSKFLPDTFWSAVRAWYVRGVSPDTGDIVALPSAADIVRRYEVPLRTVEDRSQREGWMKAREAHQDALLREEDRLAVREKARFRVRGELAFLQSSLRVQQQAARRVQNDELTAGDLQKVAGALRTSQQVFQVSLGKAADGPTEVIDWTVFSRPPAQQVIDVFAEEDGADVEDL